MSLKKFKDVRYLEGIMGSEKALKTPDIETLETLSFNEGTRWTDPEMANELLEYGKIPPFGIDALHRRGLDGRGITTAIIDQPLALDHPEYKGKIISYKNFNEDRDGYKGNVSSMHGPAVTSLLVGETTGVAPKAKVIYAAIPTWTGDAQYAVDALDWILEENKELKEEDRIKFVSVSAAFGSKKIFPKNNEVWKKKVEEVQRNGICIVECTEGNRFATASYIDRSTGEVVYGYPNLRMRAAQVGQVHVPNSLRTVAESYDNKTFSYAYWGVGGLSWGIPYAVGLLCLGQQANSELDAFQLRDIMIETAQKNKCVVDPKGFIAEVLKQKRRETSEEEK